MNTTANTEAVSTGSASATLGMQGTRPGSGCDSQTQRAAVAQTDVECAGALIAQKYGPTIGWKELQTLLLDRSCVLYPCELRFDAEPLLPGEFGYVAPKGVHPDEGFTLYLHPQFSDQLEKLPFLVLHQLATVNYGALASAEQAELLGSRALGISQEEYFRILCDLSDQLGGDDLC